jgi:hypothetical protein
MTAVSSRVSFAGVPVMQSNVEQLLLDLQAGRCLKVCQTNSAGAFCLTGGILHRKGAARARLPPAALDLSLPVGYASCHLDIGSTNALWRIPYTRSSNVPRKRSVASTADVILASLMSHSCSSGWLLLHLQLCFLLNSKAFCCMPAT